MLQCQTCDTVPEDSDSPFVVHKICCNEESSNSYFKLFFTTKRLINLTALPRLALHADATYKLIWNGFPVLLVGATDSGHTFHPFGLAVVPNEDEDSFAFLFRTLRTLAHEINGAPLHSSPVLSDAAAAIYNGFNTAKHDVDPEETSPTLRLLCWFHVAFNIKKKLHLIKSDEKREKVHSDLCLMQLSPDQVFFTQQRQHLRKSGRVMKKFTSF